MNCYLCGNGEGHHLGCFVAQNPTLTPAQAVQLGLLPKPAEGVLPEERVEVLQEGSMTTVPEMRTVGQCEFGDCDNPKHSDHSRVKFCEDHRDPKNRKE